MFGELWRLLKSKDAIVCQRERSSWLSEGDVNTKYFHRCVKARASRNSIKALKVEDEWVQTPIHVRRVVVDYFKKQVSITLRRRPRFDGVPFSTLSQEENMGLIAPFTLEEIEKVVKESDSGKSPGPDGFNNVFLKEFWYLLKHEVHILFDQFYGNTSLPKSFLSYFVALIPNVKSPFSLKDFRPISLLGSLYKLISKVLACRLSKVMASIISNSRSAFLKGRNLVDGVVVINEVVDLAKKSKRECLILKVDFEKAYDSVDWGFLEYMMKRVGMCDTWILWMKVCVFGGNMSILINGSPVKEICIQRGLKQGDPLAPFLFLLVVEDFSGVMSNVVNRNLFKGFEVKRGER